MSASLEELEKLRQQVIRKQEELDAAEVEDREITDKYLVGGTLAPGQRPRFGEVATDEVNQKMLETWANTERVRREYVEARRLFWDRYLER